MTNKEILEKAISKAIEGGWPEQRLEAKYYAADVFGHDEVEKLIFSHSFAKALWGEEILEFDNRSFGTMPDMYKWEYELQQMVIADDPIKYLGENI